MKPLILNFITHRKKGKENIIYKYNHKLSLNEVKLGGENKPFIDIHSDILNIRTATRQAQEGDDEAFNILNKKTVTEVSRERVKTPYLDFMEFQTKTFASKERDDESFTNFK